MKKHLSKKRVVLAAIVAVALAIGSGVAYAYWTSDGDGFGSATAGSAAILDVSVDIADGIHPDGSAAVTGTITNNTTSPIYVSQVAFDLIETPSGCLAADFHFVTVAPTGGATTLDPGNDVDYAGSLTMDNTTVPQDACQGAPLTLHLTAS